MNSDTRPVHREMKKLAHAFEALPAIEVVSAGYGVGGFWFVTFTVLESPAGWTSLSILAGAMRPLREMAVPSIHVGTDDLSHGLNFSVISFEEPIDPDHVAEWIEAQTTIQLTRFGGGPSLN